MNTAQIHPLPSNLVKLLEEKHKLGGKLGPQGAQFWNDLMPSLLRAHFNFRALASHPKLQEIGLELSETLDRLQKTVQDPQKHREFTADCFRVYALMDRFVRTRGELNPTRLSSVNRLIHAIHAHLMGNLHVQAINVYANETRLGINEMVDLYKQVAPTLEEPTRQALLKGIDSFTQAFQELKEPTEQNLKNAVVNLANGAELMHHLLKWKEDFEKADASPIPLVGDFVRKMAKELQQQGQLNPDTLQEWVEERFWDLQEKWAVTRHDLFMPRAQKDRIVERLDSLMVNLRDLDQVPPRVQEQLLANLEAQYAALSETGFNVEHLQEHPLDWLVDLFIAVLAKGVPRFKIVETIEEFKGTDLNDYAVFLQSYLEEGDRDYILDALTKIQNECDERLASKV